LPFCKRTRRKKKKGERKSFVDVSRQGERIGRKKEGDTPPLCSAAANTGKPWGGR